MSDTNPIPPGNLPVHSGPPRVGGGGAARQRASVTIERQTDEDSSSLMDPATKSLSDALRITFRLVQASMIGLIFLYILSGFRSVSEGEAGIRLTFGRPTSEDVTPGFKFSWPEPFGELVKVPNGPQALSIDSDFFPYLEESEKAKIASEGVQFLANGGMDALNPESDGSVLCADGAVAHTRWAVTYRRDDPGKVERRIDPDSERQIVRAAVRRGVVRACASVSIDELLKNAPDPSRPDGTFRTVESIAREVAQKTLEQMGSGIRIDQLLLTAKMPPRRVMSAFNDVQTSQANASKKIEDARAERRKTLTSAAGDAAELLLSLIEQYEGHFEGGRQAQADEALGRIEQILLGEGRPDDPRAFGQAVDEVAEARNYRSTIVSQARSDAQHFQSKLAAYRLNPLVVLHDDWSTVMGEYLSRPTIQTLVMPPGFPLVISTNRNPEITAEQERQRSAKRARESQEQRAKEFERQKYSKPVDTSSSPG